MPANTVTVSVVSELWECDCGSEDQPRYYPCGWFSWFCFPGCLPDSDPCGPFSREWEALREARDMGGLS